MDPLPLLDDACEQPARRAVLRTWLGDEAGREEYAAAFTAKDGSGKAVHPCL